MVTWTFDLLTLIIGLFIGIVIGMFLLLFIQMKDGGMWSEGFNDGFEAKRFIEKYMKKEEHEEDKYD